MIELTSETFRQAVEAGGFGAAGVGFLAGLAFSLNPVAVAAIPVALAYVTKARKKREALRFGLLFVAGMVTTHVLLGLVAGLGGYWVDNLLGGAWGLLLGPLLIVLGMVWIGWLKVPLPSLRWRARRPVGGWGAFAFGVPFTLAVCPVCTPALVALLGIVAAVGSPTFGVAMLLTFALGRAVPILVGAWTISSLDWLQGLSRFRRIFDMTAGSLLVVTGIYLLNTWFVWFPELVI